MPRLSKYLKFSPAFSAHWQTTQANKFSGSKTTTGSQPIEKMDQPHPTSV